MQTVETVERTTRRGITYSLAEVAEITEAGAISKHVRSGLLPTLRIGRRHVVPEAALARYIQKNMSMGTVGGMR